MKKISRRQALTTGSAVAIGAAVGVPTLQQMTKSAKAAIAPVVVVGGGMAGATAAKYIRYWSAKAIPVILIESNATYTSNIMSNLVLTGQKTLASLSYAYTTLKSATYGVSVVQGTVTSVDSAGKTVTYQPAVGAPVIVAYSRLVMAPGIDFLPFNVAGRPTVNDPSSKIVHAWQAGAQTTSLRNQLVAMPSNGTFILTIPKKPYRCPPGPYERAALVADWIKTNKRLAGYTSPQVIVLDANPSIQAEPTNFTNAFNVVHAGVVNYVSNAVLKSVDAGGAVTKVTATVNGVDTDYFGDVVNVITDHTAPKILRDMGLATAATPMGGVFCPVDVLSYQSTVPGMSDIHVIGDAQGSANQPKAGHIGSQEGKICADAIVRALLNAQAPDPNPVTNSACYSPITATTASWLSVVFQYNPITLKMEAVAGQPVEAPSISTGNYSQMNTWFAALMGDVFK